MVCMSVFHTSCPVHPALPAEALPPPVSLSCKVASLRQQLTELGVGPRGGGRGTVGRSPGCRGRCAQQMDACAHTGRWREGAGEAAFTADLCTGAGQDSLLKEESDATARWILTNPLQSMRYSGRSSFCTAHFFWILC